MEFKLHFCFDPTAERFKDVPTNECKKISKAFDLEQWGNLLESKFDTTDGDICAADESKSNHPNGELNTQADRMPVTTVPQQESQGDVV